MQTIVFRGMGCEIRALLDREPAVADPELALVPGRFAAWEQCLSRFRADSELSVLNQMAGAWTPVSSVLWDVVDAALVAAAATDGLVAPTVLAALEATGYDRSFELLSARGPSAPAAGGVLAAKAAHHNVMSWWTIERDATTRALRLPPGMRLDLGGIAKGWAAEQAAMMLGRMGPALVDAGGDVAVAGPPPEGRGWTIGVVDPTAPDSDLECLVLRQGVVATSGRDYRRWQQAGAWQHHILDPRTGEPAIADTLSATVIAPTAVQAEAAAKVAMILGSRQALTWIEARPALAGLLVRDDGQVIRSHRLAAFVA